MHHPLITGANGFVGAALARALAASGTPAGCLVRPRADLTPLEGIAHERVEGDVTDAASLARAVRGRDVVFHLAGIRRAATREDFFHVNAEGTRRLCEALVATGTRPRLVMVGSLGASGPSRPGQPHVEDAPPRPTDWYGESKAEAERIAFAYADRLPVTVLRPPRIVGPGDHENLLLFRLVARGLRLELGGGPRPLTLVDVEDVVDLLRVLAERDEALGEAFFVGHPEPLSLERIQELAAEALGLRTRAVPLPPAVLTALAVAADGVSRLTGRRLPLNRKFARQLLAPAWTCSSDKAARVLGFRATRDPAEAIRHAARWYREHGWL
jgi:dihydroflavonol-4-reductase